MSQQKINRGSFRVNQFKKTDSHADFTGKVNIEGIEYWINIYTKEGDNGEWWSVNFNPVADKKDKPTLTTSGTSSMSRKKLTTDEILDDDTIPF